MRFGIDGNRSLLPLNTRFDNIHPDAASGNLTYFIGGRQPGQKHQLKRFLLGYLIGFARVMKFSTAFSSRSGNAAPVVGNGQANVRAFAANAQKDFSGFLFAEQAARFGRFDAVRDRIAQKMQQRLDQGVENLRVEFEIFALDYQILQFRSSSARYANCPLKPRRQRAEFYHSKTQKLVLHFFNQASLSIKKQFEIALSASSSLLIEKCRRRFRPVRASSGEIPCNGQIRASRIAIFATVDCGFGQKPNRLTADRRSRRAYWLQNRFPVFRSPAGRFVVCVKHP